VVVVMSFSCTREAERAVESLIARINGFSSAVHVLLAPQLVVRASSVP
jgi:DNA-binding LacI/PurR family transcriptional regulator